MFPQFFSAHGHAVEMPHVNTVCVDQERTKLHAAHLTEVHAKRSTSTLLPSWTSPPWTWQPESVCLKHVRMLFGIKPNRMYTKGFNETATEPSVKSSWMEATEPPSQDYIRTPAGNNKKNSKPTTTTHTKWNELETNDMQSSLHCLGFHGGHGEGAWVSTGCYS